MKRSIHLFCGLLSVLLLGGCMGYQLGGTRPEGVQSVFIAPIINKTDEPAIEIQVTEALRGRIQFDGRLQLKNTEQDADAIIEVTLFDYNLTPTAFRSDLETTAAQYRIRITGIAMLKNAKTGEVISDSNAYGEATFNFDADLTSSKRDALPRAAEDIAKYMADDLIERW
jgi:hypothetical protein